MDPRVCPYKIWHFPNFQGEGCFLKRLLHAIPTETSQITALLGRTAIRILGSQFCKWDFPRNDMLLISSKYFLSFFFGSGYIICCIISKDSVKVRQILSFSLFIFSTITRSPWTRPSRVAVLDEQVTALDLKNQKNISQHAKHICF